MRRIFSDPIYMENVISMNWKQCQAGIKLFGMIRWRRQCPPSDMNKLYRKASTITKFHDVVDARALVIAKIAKAGWEGFSLHCKFVNSSV